MSSNLCNATYGNVTCIMIAKKGMANKAMLKNVKTGNMEKLRKQVDKGTVKIYKK